MRPHNWVFQLLTQINGPFRVVVCLLACRLLLFTCQILEAHLEPNSLKAVSLFLHTNRRTPKFAFPPTVEKLLFPFVGKDRDQQPWGPKLKLHWRETGSRFPRDTEFVFPGQGSTKSGLSFSGRVWILHGWVFQVDPMDGFETFPPLVYYRPRQRQHCRSVPEKAPLAKRPTSFANFTEFRSSART